MSTDAHHATRADGSTLRLDVGISLLTRRAAAPEPKVLLDHFDGSHMGIGVSLWRSRITSDAGLRQLVVDVVDPAEALHSVTEIAMGMLLLITQLARMNAVPCARHFIDSTPGLDESQATFVREIAQSIDDDQSAVAALISLLSVDAVTDVVVRMAEYLESAYGISVERQIAAHVEHLATTI